MRRWDLSCEVSRVTSKNEWSCFYPLGREIAAVFGRSAQVNVLSEVLLPIPFSAPPWLVCAACITDGVLVSNGPL